MLSSSIDRSKAAPRLLIDGREVPAMAYTTYFEERSGYEDFLKAGYRIFFVNASFTSLPINSFTGFTPFRVGIFEDPEKPDYSELDDAVHKILRACPEAVIIPRLYVSMPKSWVEVHEDETAPTLKGGRRELLYSEAFRRDAAELLVRAVRYIKQSDYESRIGGWQICGGQTQEWFYHGNNGGPCEAAREPFKAFVKENYREDNAKLPSVEEFSYNGESYNKSENARRYSRFCNIEVAKTLDFLSETLKRETEYKQIVGSFYGYATQSNSTALFGTHGLRILLDSPNIDFFSSPNSYSRNREFGIDWADMIPVSSIKQHGKLAFVECDIRTFLTSGIQEARPGEYPDDLYRADNGASVWCGPPTAELSREALRKCFAHQITNGSAIWWFDMWGGWYGDPMLMADLEKMRDIYATRLSDNDIPLSAEVAFFADERGFSNLVNKAPEHSGVLNTRTEMGNAGAPYDFYMVEDAETVLRKYKAAVFVMPYCSEAGERAMALCREWGIPYLTATPEHYTLSAKEIREFYLKSKVHLYTEDDDVVYAGNGFFGIHSLKGGKKSIKLPCELEFTPMLGADKAGRGDIIELELGECATALFEVKR